jgi:hypothetical protein
LRIDSGLVFGRNASQRVNGPGRSAGCIGDRCRAITHLDHQRSVVPLGCPAGPVIQRAVVRRSGRIRWEGQPPEGQSPIPPRRDGVFPLFRGVRLPSEEGDQAPRGSYEGEASGDAPFSVPCFTGERRDLSQKGPFLAGPPGDSTPLRRGEGVRLK